MSAADVPIPAGVALLGAPAPVAALAPAGRDVARILLVRHGATAWNADGRYQGSTDVPLSDGGRAEVAALGVALRGVAIDAAYTSPLVRARETATTVLAGRHLRSVVVPALAELSYGAWQGQRRADRLAAAPMDVARWEATPWAMAFPGGESLDDVQRRVVPVWERLVEAHRGECVLVSAHGHVNRVLLLHALAMPRDAFWSVPQPNAACVVLDAGESGTMATLLAAPPRAA